MGDDTKAEIRALVGNVDPSDPSTMDQAAADVAAALEIAADALGRSVSRPA